MFVLCAFRNCFYSWTFTINLPSFPRSFTISSFLHLNYHRMQISYLGGTHSHSFLLVFHFQIDYFHVSYTLIHRHFHLRPHSVRFHSQASIWMQLQSTLLIEWSNEKLRERTSDRETNSHTALSCNFTGSGTVWWMSKNSEVIIYLVEGVI